MAQAQYMKDGWRPHGPGRCRCPRCGGVTSTNALARARHKCRASTGAALDANGLPLLVGDTVRKIEFGPNAIHRLVKAVGEGEHLSGFIMVTSSIAWESSKRFEKIVR